jgi:hypothetical protein
MNLQPVPAPRFCRPVLAGVAGGRIGWEINGSRTAHRDIAFSP